MTEPDESPMTEPMARGDSGRDASPSGPGTAVPPRPLRLSWTAVASGAACGLVVLIAVATLRAVLDREVEDFGDSGWVLPLFLLLVVGYLVAGAVAQRRAADAGAAASPLTHGALAGIGAFVAWIPIRVVVWIARDEERGLVRGSDAALRPGQVFGAIVIAAAFGMIGAVVTERRLRRREP